jgi:hypothetical protein
VIGTFSRKTPNSKKIPKKWNKIAHLFGVVETIISPISTTPIPRKCVIRGFL